MGLNKYVFPSTPDEGIGGKMEDERSIFNSLDVKKESKYDVPFELFFLQLIMLTLFQPTLNVFSSQALVKVTALC